MARMVLTGLESEMFLPMAESAFAPCAAVAAPSAVRASAAVVDPVPPLEIGRVVMVGSFPSRAVWRPVTSEVEWVWGGADSRDQLEELR